MSYFLNTPNEQRCTDLSAFKFFLVTLLFEKKLNSVFCFEIDNTFLRNINVDEQPSLTCEKMLRQLVLASCDGPVDSAVNHVALCSPVYTSRNSGDSIQIQCTFTIKYIFYKIGTGIYKKKSKIIQDESRYKQLLY